MLYIFIILLITVANISYSASYPTGVYAFELIPHAVEYFVSPLNNKIQIHRSLDIMDQGFYFNVGIKIIYQNQEFEYNTRILINSDGTLYIESLSDPLYTYVYSSKTKKILPGKNNISTKFQTQLGTNISINYKAEHPMVLELTLGTKKYHLFFEEGSGISKIDAEGETFSKTTLRIYQK